MPFAAPPAATLGAPAEARTQLLRSTSLPAVGGGSLSATRLACALAGTTTPVPGRVAWPQLQAFLFPPELEHPESTGRLELFARHGPADHNGCLRGGRGGKHVHAAGEIRLMIRHDTREALFLACSPKPRDNAELLVDQLLPVALQHHYSLPEVRQLLRGVRCDSSGLMDFTDLQDVVLASQRQRLRALVKGGAASALKERGPVVPYQSTAAVALREVIRKKKLTHPEEQLSNKKRLQAGCTLIAGLEEQNLTNTLTANVQLIRGLGDVNDRWDRYCALRRTGKSSYVEARNALRPADYVFDDGGMKHRGCSCLKTAGVL